jgi:hypothetical protein
VVLLLAGKRVGHCVIGLDVVSLDFFHDFVGAADLLVFDVEDRVDEVFALKHAEAIFQAEAGEDGAIAECSLAVEVELSGPPGGCTIFELSPEGVKVIAATLRAEGREVLNLEAAGFLQVVIVGDDVGTLLRSSGERECADEKRDGYQKQSTPGYRHERIQTPRKLQQTKKVYVQAEILISPKKRFGMNLQLSFWFLNMRYNDRH